MLTQDFGLHIGLKPSPLLFISLTACPLQLSTTNPLLKFLSYTPTYTFLKVFGCLCYQYLRPYKSHKVQVRSSPRVFLRYSLRHKGYKGLHSSGRFFISRHMIFDETQFPFKDKTYSFSVPFSTLPESTLSSFIPICTSIPTSSPSTSCSLPSAVHSTSSPCIVSSPNCESSPHSSPIATPTPIPNTHPMVLELKQVFTNLRCTFQI